MQSVVPVQTPEDILVMKWEILSNCAVCASTSEMSLIQHYTV